MTNTHTLPILREMRVAEEPRRDVHTLQNWFPCLGIAPPKRNAKVWGEIADFSALCCCRALSRPPCACMCVKIRAVALVFFAAAPKKVNTGIGWIDMGRMERKSEKFLGQPYRRTHKVWYAQRTYLLCFRVCRELMCAWNHSYDNIFSSARPIMYVNQPRKMQQPQQPTTAIHSQSDFMAKDK